MHSSVIADGRYVISISATTDELGALKEQFLASLNHEMRTPLSGILGMVDLLLETDLTNDQKEYLDATHQCAESLLEIMNSALEFSALSADQVVLEESEFSLRSMLNDALDDFAFKAKVKGLRLIRYFAPEVPEVVIGDALRLRQILSQVAGNAIKFTSKGEVEVKVSAMTLHNDNLLLCLLVRDTGIGIPPDKLPQIFDSFRQIESGLARRYTGMGLGLAVTQKLVDLMHGQVSVNSQVGIGSEFSINIPLRLSREHAVRQHTPHPRIEISGPRTFQILVVEDNPVARTVVEHVLHRRPYHVVCANDGPAAIQAAEKNHYDLILMDLHMPEMDGFDTAARIRRLPGYVNTPIIALTANCSPEHREQCIQQGLQGFLAKPVQSTELLKAVEAFLPAPKGPVSPPQKTACIAV
jgi:CheY-like chemotaxis protein/two-component sensor histidine kinase